MILVAPLVLDRLALPAAELSRQAWVARSNHPGQAACRPDQVVAAQTQERRAAHPVWVHPVHLWEPPEVTREMAGGQRAAPLDFPPSYPSQSMACPPA